MRMPNHVGKARAALRKTRPESKAKGSQCPHLHALIGHAKNQDGATTALREKARKIQEMARIRKKVQRRTARSSPPATS